MRWMSDLKDSCRKMGGLKIIVITQGQENSKKKKKKRQNQPLSWAWNNLFVSSIMNGDVIGSDQTRSRLKTAQRSRL
jgi:hypothetical protein